MNPPKSRENSITHYYIAEENLVGSVKEQNADYDLMAAVMICLGKEEDSGTDLLTLKNSLDFETSYTIINIENAKVIKLQRNDLQEIQQRLYRTPGLTE